MIDDIERLLSRGRLPQALSELEQNEIGSRTDGSVRYCNLLTDLAFHGLDLDKAGYWSAKALEIEPESVTALHRAALVAWNQEKPGPALEWVRKCLDLQPRYRGALDLSLLMGPPPSREAAARDLRKMSPSAKKKAAPFPSAFIPALTEKRIPRCAFCGATIGSKRNSKKSSPAWDSSSVEKHPDIHIHLFGSPSKSYDEDSLNLVWLYSHPDQVTIDNLRQFDGLFCGILPLPAHTPGHGIFAHRADARLHRQEPCSGPDRA